MRCRANVRAVGDCTVLRWHDDKITEPRSMLLQNKTKQTHRVDLDEKFLLKTPAADHRRPPAICCRLGR